MIKKRNRKEVVYNVYRITFDRVESWSFVNEFARNIMIFGIDNNSSRHSENCKKQFFDIS